MGRPTAVKVLRGEEYAPGERRKEGGKKIPDFAADVAEEGWGGRGRE